MEEKSEQHATTPSERTTSREKSGPGTSPCANAYSHTTFMNETKANMQHQATQLNNQAAQLRNLEVQMGQMANLYIDRKAARFLTKQLRSEPETGRE